MFKKLLRNVRSRPKEQRDKLAFGIAAGFTAMVFVIWAYHLPARIESMQQAEEQTEASPVFSQFVSEVKDTFSGGNEDEEALVNFNEAFQSITTTTPRVENTANVITAEEERPPVIEEEEKESVVAEKRDRSPMPSAFGFAEQATSTDSADEDSTPNSLPDSPTPSENENAPEEAIEPLEPGMVLIEAVSDEGSETAP